MVMATPTVTTIAGGMALMTAMVRAVVTAMLMATVAAIPTSTAIATAMVMHNGNGKK